MIFELFLSLQVVRKSVNCLFGYRSSSYFNFTNKKKVVFFKCTYNKLTRVTLNLADTNSEYYYLVFFLFFVFLFYTDLTNSVEFVESSTPLVEQTKIKPGTYLKIPPTVL